MKREIVRSLCLSEYAFELGSFSRLAASYALATKNRLAKLLREAGDDEIASLVDDIRVSRSTEYWSPELGLINQRIDEEGPACVNACSAQYILFASRLNHSGNATVSFAFDPPQTFYWGGLPLTDVRSVEFEGNHAHFRTSDARSAHFELSEIHNTWSLKGDPAIISLSTDIRSVIIESEPLNTSVILGNLAAKRLSWSIDGDYDGPYADAEDETLLAIHAGLSLLAELGADLLFWVSDALRYVALVPPVGHQRSLSGSGIRRPGFSYMQSSALDSLMAEQLVHEASHQYFFMMNMLSPVATGEKKYYSPIKRAYRTLGQNMAAYHANANMLSFYERLLRARPSNEALLEAERYRHHLAAYTDTFRKAGDFTETGAIAFDEISQKIQSVANPGDHHVVSRSI